LLIILKPSADEAVTTWVVSILFYDVLLSAVIGTAFGYALRKALKHARARECIDRESLLTFTVAIALFDIGFSVLAGTNEFLVCFFCGISLNWNDAIRSDDIHSHFSEGIEMVLDCAVFLILGTILPFDTWKGDGVLPLARLVGLGILVMLLRRLPWILLLSWFIPQIKTLKEVRSSSRVSRSRVLTGFD
jgi:NhaP-type Na+/H+ or K+/H+ antiporter